MGKRDNFYRKVVKVNEYEEKAKKEETLKQREIERKEKDYHAILYLKRLVGGKKLKETYMV